MLRLVLASPGIYYSVFYLAESNDVPKSEINVEADDQLQLHRSYTMAQDVSI